MATNIMTQKINVGRALFFPFKAAGWFVGKLMRIALILMLAISILASVWLAQPMEMETGVGEMTRFEAVKVYVKMVRTIASPDCVMLYIMGAANDLVIAPLAAIDNAFHFSWMGGSPELENDIDPIEIPAETVRIFTEGMYGIFHGGGESKYRYDCRLPEPKDWTPELIGR